jgi:mRNA interferase YafQ
LKLIPRRSARFNRDVKKAKKRHKDMDKLRIVVLLLLDGQPLPERYKDHPLKGEWAGFRDAHLEPDWLLIYRVEGVELQLARTGTHAELFGN